MGLGAAAALAVLAAPGIGTRAESLSAPPPVTVPPLPPSTTYILPVYLGTDFAQDVSDLRSRLGEGNFVKVGFTSYVFVSMDDWTVDTSDPAAVQAALAGTIAQIDAAIARALPYNLPIALSFLTPARSGYDPVQHAAENEDRRNMQWYTDNALASGWTTYSQYARKLRRVEEAYIREIGQVLADRMSRYPNILVAAAGDGEIEMTYDRWVDIAQAAPPSWGDYSPFAVAEFRDWLRQGGLYGAGGTLAGQAYGASSRYVNDASPGEDTNGDGHTLNGDFGTAFTTWALRYEDWSLADDPDHDPRAIGAATYAAPGWAPADNGAGAFDAPRVRQVGNAWWEAWITFRQTMVWRHNRDFASVDHDRYGRRDNHSRRALVLVSGPGRQPVRRSSAGPGRAPDDVRQSLVDRRRESIRRARHHGLQREFATDGRLIRCEQLRPHAGQRGPENRPPQAAMGHHGVEPVRPVDDRPVYLPARDGHDPEIPPVAADAVRVGRPALADPRQRVRDGAERADRSDQGSRRLVAHRHMAVTGADGQGHRAVLEAVERDGEHRRHVRLFAGPRDRAAARHKRALGHVHTG